MLHRAGGGYPGTFGFRKQIALQGGVAATITPVALLFATKHWCDPGVCNTATQGPCRCKRSILLYQKSLLRDLYHCGQHCSRPTFSFSRELPSVRAKVFHGDTQGPKVTCTKAQVKVRVALLLHWCKDSLDRDHDLLSRIYYRNNSFSASEM